MAIFGRGHGASEPGGTGEPAETPGRGRLTRSVIGWVGAVAVVVSLAGSGWCGWVLFEKHQTDVAAGQALQAARSYVVKLATMDCERIDHNMRDILEGSTGEFKDKYGKSSAHLRQLLADNRVATHGTVVAASVKSATTNKVVVLMFIDQSVSNRNSPTPQIDRSRIKVIMDKVNGRWLASKVELLRHRVCLLLRVLADHVTGAPGSYARCSSKPPLSRPCLSRCWVCPPSARKPTTSIGTPSRNANPAAIGRPTPVTGYTVVCRSARRRGIPTVVSGRRRPRVPSNRSRSQTTL